INCGEQLLYGARRRFAERLVEVNRLCKLLADEVIAPREFGVFRERLLDAISVAAAQRPRRMPRQEGLDLAKKAWITRQCSGTARLPPMHQSSKRGPAATKQDRRASLPPFAPPPFQH